MDLNFGGPVWHASVKTYSGDVRMAEEMALAALHERGDAVAGEWRQLGGSGVFHVRRRLSADEVRLAGNITMRDVRGTPEERRRFAVLFNDVPMLRALLRTETSSRKDNG